MQSVSGFLSTKHPRLRLKKTGRCILEPTSLSGPAGVTASAKAGAHSGEELAVKITFQNVTDGCSVDL
eukprot:860368-Rhodomonas_salina.2